MCFIFSPIAHVFSGNYEQLFLTGHPTEVEEVDLLILASQWAGIAYIRQVKLSYTELCNPIQLKQRTWIHELQF